MIRVVLVLIGMALYACRAAAVNLIGLAVLAAWVCGWVLASGFWSTLFAVICPPWGWYLLAEAALVRLGML